MLLGLYLIVTVVILGWVVSYFVRDVAESGFRYLSFGDGLIGLGVVIFFLIGLYLTFTQVIHLHLNFTFSVSTGS